MPLNQSAVRRGAMRVWHANEVKRRTAVTMPICLYVEQIAGKCAQLTEMEQQVGVGNE